jgi:hypothetical protein
VRSDIVALQIKPGDGTVKAGTAIQLTLLATSRGGGTDLIPGNTATWASSSDAIAEVNRQGRLNPRRPGTVSITASYAGKTARADFTVAG